MKENQCLLVLFSGCLFLTFVLMVAGAVMAYGYQDTLEKLVKKGLAEMKKEYESNAQIKKSLDDIHQEFKCCEFSGKEKNSIILLPKRDHCRSSRYYRGPHRRSDGRSDGRSFRRSDGRSDGRSDCRSFRHGCRSFRRSYWSRPEAASCRRSALYRRLFSQNHGYGEDPVGRLQVQDRRRWRSFRHHRRHRHDRFHGALLQNQEGISECLRFLYFLLIS